MPVEMLVRVTDVQQAERLPRAVVLARLRERLGCAQVAERDLLRDVIFLLQGISGTYVRLHSEWQLPADGVPERAPALEFVGEAAGPAVPAPTKDMVHRLAELGQLFQRVAQFVEAHEREAGTPRITQSLCHFFAQEMHEYYGLVAALEAQWDREAAPVEHEAPASRSAAGGAPLTLRRLVHATREPLLRFRLMSAMVESARKMHGGALVSTIHAYTLTGDPFIRAFTARLLDHVSRPFFQSLSRWIYDGELQDPFAEFFVALHAAEPRAPPQRVAAPEADLVVPEEHGTDAGEVWHHKFTLRRELIPSFLSEGFARKIFSTGKSLNFIRSSCGDGDWAATCASLNASGRALRYSDLAGLEHTIDAVYSIASTRLMHIFLHQFRLLEHLRALKEYLLLTRGDFVDALLQTLGASLERPASTLYQHNLSAALETAIRASSAQYDDAEILRRVDARSLESHAGECGWDTFTLEYHVESPVSAVLDASAMAGYQILFNYLWKIKRVERAVNRSWMDLVATNNYMLRSRMRRDVPPPLAALAHQTLARLAEVIHFVRQLQGFCELEVIAYSWHALEHYFAQHSGGDLDQLIESHRAYLGTLINTALLRGGRRGHADQLQEEVRAQLDTALAFCLAADDLSHHVTAELARLAAGAPARGAPEHVLSRLDAHHATFQQRMHVMITALERHPNLSVRDLARRWNYNVYYRRVDSREHTERREGVTIGREHTERR